jgi:hypothetical protein
MADTKQTKSTSTKESGDTEVKFCCGDSAEMSQIMRQFCKSEDGNFDCGKMMQMMQKMCCAAPEKSGKQ